jgi:predicted transcriptional regulator
MSPIDWRTELDKRPLSQRELAHEADVHPTTVNRVVNGKSHGRASTVRRMKEGLQRFPVLEAY